MKKTFQICFSASLGLSLLFVTMATGFGQSDNKDDSKIAMKPVAIKDGVAKLDPTNSKIEFVGTHADKNKPDPRLGGFKKFTGEIKLAGDNMSIDAIKFEIDVSSVWTEFAKLTAHLKNADFFEIEKYGMAKFASSKVGQDDKGNTTITGNLTLHGTTAEITFPVKAKVNDAGLLLMSEFKLDRTMFGMDKMTSGVEKTVSVKLAVGQKTEPKKEMAGPGTNKQSSSTSKTSTTQTVSLSVPNML